MSESFPSDDFIRAVIDQYSDTIFRVSYQYVKNRPDAEDILQEVLLELVQYLKRAKFQSDEHMKAWLIRVSINKSINVAKANARRRKKETLDTVFGAERLDPQYDDLQFELDKLSAIDREVIYLHYFERYSAKEIAAILDKTEKSIFKRLSRARQKLKGYILEGGEQ